MKKLNFLIIGVPSSVSNQKIAIAGAAIAKVLGLSQVHVEVLETSKFRDTGVDKEAMETMLKDIFTVCTAAGLTNIAAINANFWRLVEDGKLTRNQINLLLSEGDFVLDFFKNNNCPYIFDLLEQALKVL